MSIVCCTNAQIHDNTTFTLHIGIKVFCLVLSTGFLYNWHVYRAKEDPLRGDNYMYRLIYDTLLGDELWDYTNAVVYFDAAFTSVKLVRDLYNNRGISAVGPINAKRPDKGGNADSWPHHNFKSSDTKYLNRGWDRLAFQKLDRDGWMQVTCSYTHSLHTHIILSLTHSYTLNCTHK